MGHRSVTVLLNCAPTPEEQERHASDIRKAFLEAGGDAHIVTTSKHDFDKSCSEWVGRAKNNNGVIVAAGGDGTVNSVARLCSQEGVTLGIIPMGTFNYFARDLSIPLALSDAVKVILREQTRAITLGAVQNHIFLNNSSFGIYSTLIRQRESASSRFGRLRVVAAFAAVYSLLHSQKLFSVKINDGGVQEPYRTAMVFIGNNTMQLENLGLDVADCTRQNKLAVIIMRNTTRLDIARLLLRGAIRYMKNESKLRQFCAESFEVTTKSKNIDLVIDGEIVRCQTPLVFRVLRDALTVLAPNEQPDT